MKAGHRILNHIKIIFDEKKARAELKYFMLIKNVTVWQPKNGFSWLFLLHQVAFIDSFTKRNHIFGSTVKDVIIIIILCNSST